MKIVYLSDSIIPSRSANSIHVMKMCQAFAHNGHQVILLAPDNPNCEPGVDNVYNFYGVDKCFEIKKISWIFGKKAIYIYGLLSGIQTKIFKPDLAYGRCLKSCFFTSILGVNVIYEAHSLPIKVSKITAQMFQNLKNSQKLKQLVVISGALAEDFHDKYGVSQRLLTVAHDGADEIKISKTVQFAEEFNIGYIGHLYPGKGMEIVAELVKACPWAFFHIIGGTEADINYWQNKLKEFKNIRFYGFIPHSQTAPFRLASDVLIAPYLRQVSSNCGENIAKWMSPLKIFEYMATGKPIIASKLPVLQEVLTHEKTALLYEPEDIEGWIAGLIRLRDDTQLRKSLGEGALREFQAKYTWKSRANLVLRENAAIAKLFNKH